MLWIEPESKSRRILIAQVRDIQHRIYKTAFAGGWKACVLVGADRMGMEAANAFLKTLEEPPSTVTIVLLTNDYDAVLPTIASRCQVVRFAPVTPSRAVAHSRDA